MSRIMLPRPKFDSKPPSIAWVTSSLTCLSLRDLSEFLGRRTLLDGFSHVFWLQLLAAIKQR
eukprot:4373443-Amphidinium_carterae.1